MSWSFVIRAANPLTQDEDAGKARRVQILGTQTFDDTFGKKSQRKRPKLGVDTYEELLTQARALLAGKRLCCVLSVHKHMRKVRKVPTTAETHKCHCGEGSGRLFVLRE